MIDFCYLWWREFEFFIISLTTHYLLQTYNIPQIKYYMCTSMIEQRIPHTHNFTKQLLKMFVLFEA